MSGTASDRTAGSPHRPVHRPAPRPAELPVVDGLSVLVLLAATGSSARALELVVSGLSRGWRGIAGELGTVTVATLWWVLWSRHRQGRTGTVAAAVGLGSLALLGLLGSLPLFRGLLLADELVVRLSIGLRLLAFVAGTAVLVHALGRVRRQRRTDLRSRPGQLLAAVGTAIWGLASLMPTTTVAGSDVPLRVVVIGADTAFAVVTLLEAILPGLLLLAATRLQLGSAAWLLGAPAAVTVADTLGLSVAFGAPTVPTVWLWATVAGAGAVTLAARWWAVLDRSRRREALRRARPGSEPDATISRAAPTTGN